MPCFVICKNLCKDASRLSKILFNCQNVWTVNFSRKSANWVSLSTGKLFQPGKFSFLNRDAQIKPNYAFRKLAKTNNAYISLLKNGLISEKFLFAPKFIYCRTILQCEINYSRNLWDTFIWLPWKMRQSIIAKSQTAIKLPPSLPVMLKDSVENILTSVTSLK